MALKFRRGTTAQQSGSLAFGEPYVNTTLGTLLVGGSSSDIQLAPGGATAAIVALSVSASSFVSASSLKITGNASIDGNLTLGGNITIGDTTSDNLVVNADLSSSIIPNDDNAFDLGSSSKKYRNIYGTSIEATNVTASAQLVTGGLSVLDGITGSIRATNGVVSGSSQVVISDTNGYTAFSSSIATTDIAQNNRLTNLEFHSTSVLGHISDINTKTGSYEAKHSTLATYTASVDGHISDINTKTGSFEAKHSTLATITASIANNLAGIATYTSSLKAAITASGANVIFSGDITVPGNLTVAGTQTTVNSTNVTIADSVLELNYGGSVVKSGILTKDGTGGSSVSGSLLWDGNLDTWVAGVSGSEAKVITDAHTPVTSSQQVVGILSSLNTFTSSIDTTIKTKLNVEGVISGSSQLTTTFDERYLNTLGDGVYSSSAQIDVLSTTNISRLATTGSNIFVGDQTITGSLAINDSATNFLIEGNGFSQAYLTSNGAIVLNPGYGGVEMVGSNRTFKATDITAEGFVSGEIRANNGVVSGSSQIKTYGDIATTGSNLFVGNQTFSGSLIPAVSGVYDIGSVANPWRHLYVGLGSIYLVGPGGNEEYSITAETIVTKDVINSGSVDLTRSLPTGSVSSSAQVVGILAPVNTYTASLDVKNSTLSIVTASLQTATASLETKHSTIGTVTASLETKHSTIGTVTASLETKHSTIGTVTASLETKNTTLATVTASFNGHISDINTKTGSLETKNTTLATYTASLETKNSTLSTVTASLLSTQTNLNSYTSSLNNAIQLTGSTVSFLGNIVVYGTQSVINSQNVEISDNILYLSPSASVDNDLGIVGHYNDGTYRHAGIFMDASDGHSWKVFNALQDETIGTVDTNGTGFTLAPFKAGAITGTSFSGQILSTNGVVSGSSQIDVASTTGDIALGTRTSGNYVASLVAGTNITLSNNSGEGATPTVGLTNNSITIAGQSTSLGGTVTAETIRTAIGTVVTSSAQITGIGNAQLTNSSILIAGQSTSLGGTVTAETIRTAIGTVVTGSSQIDHNSTTNYSANRHIDHTAVSISAGSGLSGGGDISTTRTLSIATGGVTNDMLAGSIANAKLTNSSITIAGASTSLGGTVTAETIRTAIGTVVTGSSQIAFSGVTGTVSNAQLANSSVTVTAGTGLSGGGAVSLGSSVTLSNAGVTAITAGTGVSRDTSTGNVTISIGQSVATNATPTFGNLTINGTITATGDITAFYTSDRRHKNNIQTIPNALDKVKQLNGVTWEWNDDVNEVTKSTPKTGLIAQEVQSVLPEVVIERENGFLALDYSKMIGLLVEAIKEQQTQIEDLKAQLGSK